MCLHAFIYVCVYTHKHTHTHTHTHIYIYIWLNRTNTFCLHILSLSVQSIIYVIWLLYGMNLGRHHIFPKYFQSQLESSLGKWIIKWQIKSIHAHPPNREKILNENTSVLHILIHTFLYLHASICIYLHIYTYICICTNQYIHIYAYTYICIYIWKDLQTFNKQDLLQMYLPYS